jgi:hypothetical protein
VERCRALFAGPGGAYAQSAAPDPGSCPREYRGSSEASGFLRLLDRLRAREIRY